MQTRTSGREAAGATAAHDSEPRGAPLPRRRGAAAASPSTAESESGAGLFADSVNAGVHDLPPALRASAEATYGADLSHVRVHADAEAATKAAAVGARAYALGSDIYFAEGEYRPETPDGQRLIAHELAHVVQQDGAASAPQMKRIGDTGDAFEHEADRAADAVLAGAGPVQLSRVATSYIQRTPGASSRMPSSRAPIEAAIRRVGRIDELERIIRSLEAMPAETEGMEEISIDGNSFGVMYEWAGPLTIVATHRRAELASTVSPTPETAADAAATGAMTGGGSVSAGDAIDISLGLDIGARVRVPTPLGELEVGYVHELRTGSGDVHGRARARGTGDLRSDEARRGSPRGALDPELRTSHSGELGEFGGGDLGALHLEPIQVNARGSAGVAARRGASGRGESTSIGAGVGFHFAGNLGAHAINCDLNFELIAVEVSGGELRFREPSVELAIPIGEHGRLSFRFTPSIAAVAEVLGWVNFFASGAPALAGVAGEGAAAAEIEGVALSGAGTFVAGLVFIDLIHSALEAVWAGQRFQARELDQAIALGDRIGGSMETILRDLCAGYVAVMRGDSPPSSDGGELGAREARARIESLMASMPLTDIHANARAVGDLYAQIYRVASPPFREEAGRIASEIGAQTSQPDAARYMANTGMTEHIAAAASPEGSTPPEDWHAPML